MRARDVWELEAKFLGGVGAGQDGEAMEGKLEGLKMKMGMGRGEVNGKGGRQRPVLEWMKMEESGAAGR